MSTNELSISFVPASQVLTAAIVLPCVGAVSVFTRIYLRWWHERSVKTDDWLIVAALVSLNMTLCSRALR